MYWLPWALATAVAFGLYNFSIKTASSKIDHILGAVVLQLVAAALGGVFLLVAKLGGRSLVVSPRGLLLAALAGVAVGVAEILSFVVFARGAPASLGTPVIMGGSIVAAALLGVAFLAERPAPLQWLGVVLVVVGVALASAGDLR